MPCPECENMALRPYMRMAARWLDMGFSEEEILAWAAFSRHYYDLDWMREAIPEARRALYFAERIREADPDMKLSTLWGWYSRGCWYAGYGRAPTAQEREWAYQRPQGMIGIMFRIRGRTQRMNREREFPVTVNVPWNASRRDIEDFIRNIISGGEGVPGDQSYDPLDPATIHIDIVGGALVERQATTFTMH